MVCLTHIRPIGGVFRSARRTREAPPDARVRAVVLDWAGTVVDCGVFAPVEALREAFAQLGVPISDSEARGPMGLFKKVAGALVGRACMTPAYFVLVAGSH